MHLIQNAPLNHKETLSAYLSPHFNDECYNKETFAVLTTDILGAVCYFSIT